MDLKTTMKEVFQGKKGEKANPKALITEPDERPIQKTSMYQANYPNWQNGKNDVFHEK